MYCYTRIKLLLGFLKRLVRIYCGAYKSRSNITEEQNIDAESKSHAYQTGSIWEEE